ncbi:MAG: hypothetical protein R3254_07485, partial [Thiomicrorhabdus sp.]|nr:hypothetical protein [Thiomicrorhabdus sp.]
VSLRVVVEDEETQISFNASRPDVITALLAHFPNFNLPNGKGFSLQLPLRHGQFQIVGLIDDHVFSLATVNIRGKFEIIQGKEGWLFLDNDTNRSVEQFRGKYLLNIFQRFAWRWYFLQLRSLDKESILGSAFLIAPSKESVVSDYYPIEKGNITPVEQVIKLAKQHRFSVVYPVEALISAQPRAFRKTDTHWSLNGARLAWLEAVRTLGLDSTPIEDVFNSDQYFARLQVGDLGNKVFPPKSSEELSLKNVNYRNWVVYDNHMPNFGRVIIAINNRAVFHHRLIIFGSSSTYTMLHYVCRTFTEVIFVHTASNVDPFLMSLLSPDYVILQSNGRFLIKPPSARYRLKLDIREKLDRMSSIERAEVLEKGRVYVSKDVPDWVRKLHSSIFNEVDYVAKP